MVTALIILLVLSLLNLSSNEEFGQEIMPLGGKEIIVIGPEVEGTCLFCLEFERKVTIQLSRNYST